MMDAPSELAREALTALAPFLTTSEFRARTLLAMWARRRDMTEEDFQYVLSQLRPFARDGEQLLERLTGQAVCMSGCTDAQHVELCDNYLGVRP